MQNQASYNMSHPEPFNFQQPKEWQKWIRRFERFRHASGLSEKPEQQQINTLIYCLGNEADDMLCAFSLSQEQQSKYEVVKKKFDDQFIVKRDVIFERAKFFDRSQREDESVEVFINDLYKLVEYCEFGQLHDEMIRDRIVVGVRDSKLSQNLQMDSELTLEKAVNRARHSETIKSQQGVIRKNDTVVEAVTRKTVKHYNKTFKKTAGQNTKPNCRRCGANPNHRWEECPARDVSCFKCKKKGHYGRCCEKKIEEISAGAENDSELSFFLEEINHYKDSSEPWFVNILVENYPVKFKIDTGADVTVIGKHMADQLGLKIKEKSDAKLMGPGKISLKVIGQMTVRMKYKKEVYQKIYVIDGVQVPLLGRPAIQALKVINLEVLEVETEVLSKFDGIFKGLGKISQAYNIKVKENAVPYAATTPRRIPLPLREKVKTELQRMVNEEVIVPVEQATQWCAPMVAVLKKNKSVRICVDFTELNKDICRERLVLPSVEETLGLMGGAKIFSKLDAINGFWQIPLSSASIPYTTFVTPFGRYAFKRLPFGLSSSPEHFQKRIQEILEGLEGIANQADDIVVYGKNKNEHDGRLEAALRKLEAAGVTLNKEKCIFGVTKIEFLGHVIDDTGVKPDPSKTEAIAKMKSPSNITEIRRILGMINYLRKFIPRLSEKMKPLQDLLKKENEWIWSSNHEKSFQEIKDEIVSATVLALFDPNKKTRVSADASHYGIGAVMEQLHEDTWRTVLFASRTLSDTESRYAQIEKESLGILYACEKFQNFLIGNHFLIRTDHKPLVQLLKTKPISELSPRLQRFRMRLMRFSYDIECVSGKEFYIPDTLSRAPLARENEEGKDILDEEVKFNIDIIISELPVSDAKLEEIRKAQKEDTLCEKVKIYIGNGWPTSKCPAEFYRVREELSVFKDLLMKGNRIYIPKKLRNDILNKIHEGHLGTTKCRARARESVWWPNIGQQIKQVVQSCNRCIEHRTNAVEPLMTNQYPERPWAQVGIDLFETNRTKYLVIMDYFSKYIEMINLSQTTSSYVIARTKNIFARHGIPDIVRSDNGPQFREEFKLFAKEYGFQHITSSPHFPKSNGLAERGVAIAKNIIKKCEDPNIGLLVYRSTPLECGKSPAELLFGRKIRSNLPQVKTLLKPNWPGLNKVKNKFVQLQERQKRNFNERHKVRELSPLSSGQRVWIQDMKRYGTVEMPTEEPRSYTVQTDNNIIRRNRSHLIAAPKPTQESENKEMSPGSEKSPKKPEIRIPSTASSELIISPDEQGQPKTYTTRYGRSVHPPKKLNL